MEKFAGLDNILCGDVLEALPLIADQSVHLIVTSHPTISKKNTRTTATTWPTTNTSTGWPKSGKKRSALWCPAAVSV